MDKSVKHVFFYVGLKPGNLILAELDDGSIAILRNDVVIPDYHFAASEMQAAVQTYQRLKFELINKAPLPGPLDGDHLLH